MKAKDWIHMIGISAIIVVAATQLYPAYKIFRDYRIIDEFLKAHGEDIDDAKYHYYPKH